MEDGRYTTAAEAIRSDSFKEAVCVNASRIYDACRDRECLENMRVWFPEQEQQLIDNATGVKLKNAQVVNVIIDTEPVQFNKGYYCVDMHVYIGVDIEVTVSPVSPPCCVTGLCVYNKKTVLFGSEGSVKVFSSASVAGDGEMQGMYTGDIPKATVSIAEPVCLGAKLVSECEQECLCGIPECVGMRFGGSLATEGAKGVEVSIGLFMMIRLERETQMLIPVYDFGMPEKACAEEKIASPCQMFAKMRFPSNEFFPPLDRETDCDR